MSAIKGIFGKKKRKNKHNKLKNNEDSLSDAEQRFSTGSTISNTSNIQGDAPIVPPIDYPDTATVSPTDTQTDKSKLYFKCQLAHGSATGTISSFTNVQELYEKIGRFYNIPTEEILFCTLNTPKLDMGHLLGSQIGFDDFIFAHMKSSQRKVVEVLKTAPSLGLTITDNGTGFCFVKRIKPDSVCQDYPLIQVGDHIEAIDRESFIGRRHFDVAKCLKNITEGTSFSLKLVSPEQSALNNISTRALPVSTSDNLTSGKRTLRLRGMTKTLADEPEEQRITSQVNPVAELAVKAISELIEGVIGVEDEDLSRTIWELGDTAENPHKFTLLLDQEMGSFDFPDDLIFDFWGAITDAKCGRLTSSSPGSRFDGTNEYEEF